MKKVSSFNKKNQTSLLYIFRRIVFLNFETHFPPDAYSIRPLPRKKIVYTHVRSSFFQKRRLCIVFLLTISGWWTRNPIPRPPQAAQNPWLPFATMSINKHASFLVRTVAVIDGGGRGHGKIGGGAFLNCCRGTARKGWRWAGRASRVCVLCRYLGQLLPAS